MIISCPNCQTRYNLPDDKVPESGVKVKCSRCEHVFRATLPAAEPEDEVESLLDENQGQQEESQPPAGDEFDDLFDETASEDASRSSADNSADESAEDTIPDDSGDDPFGDDFFDTDTDDSDDSDDSGGLEDDLFGQAQEAADAGDDDQAGSAVEDDLFGDDDLFGESDDEQDSGDDFSGFGDDENAEDDAEDDGGFAGFGDDDEEDGDFEDEFDEDFEDDEEQDDLFESLDDSEDLDLDEKGGRKTSVLLVVLALLAVCGFLVYHFQLLKYLPFDIPYLTETAVEEPAPGVSPEESVKNIALQNVRQYYVTNEKAGPIFVIEGKAVNNFPEPKERIEVEASLYDDKNQVLISQTLLAGNTLSLFQLQVQSQEEIESGLTSEVGVLSNNTFLRPGREVPFMIVFFSPPENVKEFGVKVVGAKNPPKE